MTRVPKRRWPFIVVGIIVFAVGFYYFNSRPIPHHKGDGAFQDLSGWVGPIPDRGYHIKFPEFDLSLPFSAEYRFSMLPNVGQPCALYLMMIDSNGDWPWNRDSSTVGGRLAFQLTKSTGDNVIEVDGALGQYVWWGFRNKHGLYQAEGRSRFDPDPSASYVLKVQYEPASEFRPMRGYVYLNSGAKYSGGRYR